MYIIINLIVNNNNVMMINNKLGDVFLVVKVIDILSLKLLGLLIYFKISFYLSICMVFINMLLCFLNVLN